MKIQTIDDIAVGAVRDIHILKCDEAPFEAVLSGAKPFEIRTDDRPYAAGDLLLLREIEERQSGERTYSGRAVLRRVTCVLRDGYGLAHGVCAMGLEPVEGLSTLFMVREPK